MVCSEWASHFYSEGIGVQVTILPDVANFCVLSLFYDEGESVKQTKLSWTQAEIVRGH